MTDLIEIACAADDAYAPHLSVRLRSLASNLSPGRSARFTILDCGMRAINKERMVRSLEIFGNRIKVVFAEVDMSMYADLKTVNAISRATYSRIALGDLMREADKALYLDSDIVVEGDVGELYDMPLGGRPIGAVRDSDPLNARNYELILGVPGRYGCFNGGVLLIDLQAWRRDGIREKIMATLAIQKFVDYPSCDQAAMNAVFAGAWKEFHPKWNFSPLLAHLKSGRRTTYDEASLREAAANPKIIHFLSPFFKPWIPGNLSPGRERYRHYLEQTSFAGTLPRTGPIEIMRGAALYLLLVMTPVMISDRLRNLLMRIRCLRRRLGMLGRPAVRT